MLKKLLMVVLLLALETVRCFFVASIGRMDSLIERVTFSGSGNTITSSKDQHLGSLGSTLGTKIRHQDTKLHYMDSKSTSEDPVSVALSSTLRNSPIRVSSPKKGGNSAASAKVPMNVPTKVGVLLLNLGGPETMDDVEGFLYNLFADPDIIRLPSLLSFMQKPIAYVIAKRRAPKSSAAYLSIGGGSPIVKYTEAQASLIQSSLRKRGLKDAQCYFAMRYWTPYTEDVLEQMKQDGVNSMVILPLYPQYSISTSGTYVRTYNNKKAQSSESSSFLLFSVL